MAGRRCEGWSEANVTSRQRRKETAAMDRHVERYPGCAAADVCVHNHGLVLYSAHCTGCGRSI